MSFYPNHPNGVEAMPHVNNNTNGHYTIKTSKRKQETFSNYNNISSIFKEIPTENQLLIYENIPNLIDFYQKVPSNELVKSMIFKKIRITKISNKSFRVKFQYPQTEMIKFNPSLHSSYIRELEIDGSCHPDHIQANLRRIIKYIFQNEPNPPLNKLIFDGVVYSSTMDQLFDINFLPSLYELDIKNHLLMNIPYMSNLYNLRSIDLCNNNIQTIDNLDNLVNLNYLNLSNNKIIELKNLSKLVSLETLNLSSNQILEIKNLSGLVNLKNLDLSNNKIIEIQNLQLVNLTNLNLSSNPITELKNLTHLTYLSNLDLSNLQVKKMRSFGNLINLQVLNLSKNRIKYITGLNGLLNLKEFDISRNFVTSISGLGNLFNLDKLDLSFNQIRRISNMRNLKNLTCLNLKNNRIRRIENLENLYKLEYLDLSNINNENTFKVDYTTFNYFQRKVFRDQQLVNISNIHLTDDQLKKIAYLYELFKTNKRTVKMLSNSEVLNFKKLITLINFNRTMVNGNNVLEMRGLENLTNLRELNLSYNRLNELKNFATLRKLRVLNCTGNQITKINEELDLPCLEFLNLSFQNNFEFIITDVLNNVVNLNYNKLGFEITGNFLIALNKAFNLRELNLIGNKINVNDLQMVSKNVRIIL